MYPIDKAIKISNIKYVGGVVTSTLLYLKIKTSPSMESESRIVLLQKSMIHLSQCRKIGHIIFSHERRRLDLPI